MAKINMGVWTQAERSQFEKGVVQFGWGKWLEITDGIPSRRKSQVKSHAQKFALHRPEEYAKLIDKHNKMEAMKKKKKVDGERVSSPKAASTQLRKKAAAKKVSRASKRLVKTAAAPAAKGVSKPALLKAENPSKKGTPPRKSVVAKEEPKLGAQPTTSKDDLGASPAEMVYGSPLTVPGEFLGVSKDDPDSSTFLQQLRAKVGQLAPTPTSTHGRTTKAHVPRSLTSADFVFVRREGHHQPLTPKYDGPYKVLRKTAKFFELQLGDRTENITVDRLKAAYTDSSQPVKVAQPPRRGRPKKNKAQKGNPETSGRTTRSGRT